MDQYNTDISTIIISRSIKLINNNNGLKNLEERIIKISKFINNKYPGTDITNKLITNLIKYRCLSEYNIGAYLTCLEQNIENLCNSDNRDSDILLNLITNNNYVDVLFTLLAIDTANYYSVKNNIQLIIKNFPYFSTELINKISPELYPYDIYFLLYLVMNKNINFKTKYEKINKQTYVDVISEIIGDDETEIRIFKLIYPYFDMIPDILWCELYTIMTSYTHHIRVVEYYSKTIIPTLKNINNIKIIKTKKWYLDMFITKLSKLINNSYRDVFSYYISRNIPIFVFDSNRVGRNFCDYQKFFIEKIVSTGFDFFDTGLEYNENKYCFEKIIVKLYNIYDTSKLFVDELIKRIFIEKRNNFHICPLLMDFYDFMAFNNIIEDEEFCSSSEIMDFLISLLDRSTDEIVLYTTLIIVLIDALGKYYDNSGHSSRQPIFRIDDEEIVLSYNSNIKKGIDENNKGIFKHILMFLIRKNDVRKSTIFVNKLEGLIEQCFKNNVIIDDNIIEFAYSKSDKAIERITTL